MVCDFDGSVDSVFSIQRVIKEVPCLEKILCYVIVLGLGLWMSLFWGYMLWSNVEPFREPCNE